MFTHRLLLALRSKPKLFSHTLILAGASGIVLLLYFIRPLALLEPDEIAVRVSRFSGTTEIVEGPWVLAVPGIHRLESISLADRIYHPATSANAAGDSPFQSVEGLSVGL